MSKVLSGKKNAEIGKVFGITIQGVTNAVRRTEKQREKDKKLNREICEIFQSMESRASNE